MVRLAASTTRGFQHAATPAATPLTSSVASGGRATWRTASCAVAAATGSVAVSSDETRAAMIGRVGYDLHITRAIFWPESDRFPILGSEVADLVRDAPDLAVPPERAQPPGPCWIEWDTPEQDALWFHENQLQSKHPRPAFRRRMIEPAARLDA